MDRYLVIIENKTGHIVDVRKNFADGLVTFSKYPQRSFTQHSLSAPSEVAARAAACEAHEQIVVARRKHRAAQLLDMAAAKIAEASDLIDGIEAPGHLGRLSDLLDDNPDYLDWMDFLDPVSEEDVAKIVDASKSYADTTLAQDVEDAKNGGQS